MRRSRYALRVLLPRQGHQSRLGYLIRRDFKLCCRNSGRAIGPRCAMADLFAIAAPRINDHACTNYLTGASSTSNQAVMFASAGTDLVIVGDTPLLGGQSLKG